MKELQLTLRLLEFDDLWSNQPDEHGRVLLEVSMPRLEFAEAVADAATKVLARHGVGGYKEMWVEHEFPSQDLERLEALVALWRS